jgi:hypothetical protein
MKLQDFIPNPPIIKYESTLSSPETGNNVSRIYEFGLELEGLKGVLNDVVKNAATELQAQVNAGVETEEGAKQNLREIYDGVRGQLFQGHKDAAQEYGKQVNLLLDAYKLAVERGDDKKDDKHRVVYVAIENFLKKEGALK